MNIEVRLNNRDPQFDATPTQKRIRNTKNWAPPAVVGLLFAASIGALIAASVIIRNSPAREFQSALQKAMPSTLMGLIVVNLALGLGTFVTFYKARKTHQTFEYLSRDFVGTKEQLKAVLNTFNMANYAIYDEDDSKENWQSKSTGWSRTNLSPNEKDMYLQFSIKISEYWYRTSAGLWFENPPKREGGYL